MIFRINPMPFTQEWESHRYSSSSIYHHDVNSMHKKNYDCTKSPIGYVSRDSDDVYEIFRDATMMADIEQTGKADYNEWNY